MNIVTELNAWQTVRATLKNRKIGFVPTMGNLHAGHLSLCRQAKTENHITVVSIFINPTQFNDKTDFTAYPRSLDQDIKLLKSFPIDYVLLPQAEEIYADDFQVQVIETNLSHTLEGTFRPGHFIGMLTIVLKLLNLVRATNAYFGEKDFQQLLLIQKMAKALFLMTEIIACPTVRAPDGLALSSRNHRLTQNMRQLASQFPRLLQSDFSLAEISHQLTQLGFKVEYICEQWGRRLGAVWLENVRLIDNIAINEE